MATEAKHASFRRFLQVPKIHNDRHGFYNDMNSSNITNSINSFLRIETFSSGNLSILLLRVYIMCVHHLLSRPSMQFVIGLAFSASWHLNELEYLSRRHMDGVSRANPRRGLLIGGSEHVRTKLTFLNSGPFESAEGFLHPKMFFTTSAIAESCFPSEIG